MQFGDCLVPGLLRFALVELPPHCRPIVAADVGRHDAENLWGAADVYCSSGISTHARSAIEAHSSSTSRIKNDFPDPRSP